MKLVELSLPSEKVEFSSIVSQSLRAIIDDPRQNENSRANRSQTEIAGLCQKLSLSWKMDDRREFECWKQFSDQKLN